MQPAGFESVDPDQAAVWNVGQPHDYGWPTRGGLTG